MGSSASHFASVSGLWNAKTWRLRGFRVEQVREARLYAGRLVQERQWPTVGRQVAWTAVSVLFALGLDAGQSQTDLLRLDRPSRSTIDV